MTDDSSTSSSDQSAARQRKKLFGKLIVFGLIIAFTLLKPKVEAWLDARNAPEVANNDNDANNRREERPTSSPVDLDGFKTVDPGKASGRQAADRVEKSSGTVDTSFLDTIDPTRSSSETGSATATKTSSRPTASAEKSQTKSSTKFSTTNKSTSKSPLPKLASPAPFPGKSDRSNPTIAKNSQPGTSSKSTTTDPRSNPSRPSGGTATTNKAEPRLGKLTLVNRNREIYKSTAGLIYGRGSIDRHRVKHVMKHAEDNLTKPVHGVYVTGDREQIFEWIDIAYLKGKKGGRGVRFTDDGDRITYTVDMGKKIGYVGGQVGKRKGKPACRYLKLVLEDEIEVVTAYPSQSP